MKRTGRRVIHTRSAEETRQLGVELAARLDDGVCIALVGPLGSGKTEFVRGACRGLDVDDEVVSPTFILYEGFAGRLPVVHVDLYRLEHESELEDLGVFDLLGGNTVVLAEWADRSDVLMAHAGIAVEIGDAGPGERRIVMTYAPEYAPALEGMPSWS